MKANNLTICFYEYPAAKPHIQMWENLMLQQGRIIKTENYEESVKAYYIRTNKEVELLITFGTFMLSDYDIYKYISYKFDYDSFLKILMFGKLTNSDLKYIKKINDTFLSIKEKK
jgi:hypothetical protein